MLARIAAVSVLLLTLLLAPLRAEAPKSWVKANLDDLVSLYRYFHTHPELSFCEKETASRLAAELKAVGADVTTGVGGHGIVAILTNGEGPTLMLRTDMDALPVAEQTGLPYASKVKAPGESGAPVGVMHACGHDLHMANLVGVARFLAADRTQWRGTVMLIGQPAEERGAGAKAMLEDGLFTRWKKPDFALALHVDPAMPTGHVGYRIGFAMANVDSVDITVRGRGGHGAYPHTTIDPVVEAAELVLALQTIVSREVKPIDPAVITVGSIHGGTKHNVIGSTCHLQITVRSYTGAVRRQLLDAIRRKAKAVALGAGAPEPVVTVSEGTPALYNDEKLAARLAPIFAKVLGPERVHQSEPSMGGEDFSHYGKAGVPIFMFRLGAVNAERLAEFDKSGQPPPSLHSPRFYPDAAPALSAGVSVLSAAALELLKPE